MINFVLSQIFGGIALILICISYFTNKKKFLILNIFADIFYGAGFIASFSLVAGINTFISIIRVIIIYFYEKKGKTTPLYYLFIFSFLYITIGVIFYNNYWDIIPLITPILFTIAMTPKELIKVKFLTLIPNILIFIYNVFNGFYTSALLDLLETIVLIVSITTYHTKNKNKNQKIQ